METLLKLTYAIEILYYVIIVTTKCSIVATYYNIGGCSSTLHAKPAPSNLCRLQQTALTRSFRVACHTTHAILCVFFVVCISVTFGQCQPLSRQWDPTLAPAARAASCINTTAFFYFTSAFNIVMDFWILGMPLKTLNSLQIRRRDRYVLYGVFGAGIFATTMSCVRLYSIYTYTLAADPFMEGSLVSFSPGPYQAAFSIWSPSSNHSLLHSTDQRLVHDRDQRRHHVRERAGVEAALHAKAPAGPRAGPGP